MWHCYKIFRKHQQFREGIVAGHNRAEWHWNMVQGRPEDFAAASDELFVLTVVLSLTLAYACSSDYIIENPLRERLAYTPSYIGWGVPPSLYVAAPLFVCVVYARVWYVYLNYMRSRQMELSHFQRMTVFASTWAVVPSWGASILIFCVQPRDSPGTNLAPGRPLAHACLFFQCILMEYVSLLANYLATKPSCHPKGGPSFCFVTVV
mmetsp:Transcript_35989/g.76803  ORF Transcript_35989/g.76803 Transcript_35989/m.76803 type:complete len:207 (-) Transcript_35989:11-631(-)